MSNRLKKFFTTFTTCALLVAAPVASAGTGSDDPIKLKLPSFNEINPATLMPVELLEKEITVKGKQDDRANLDCIGRGAKLFLDEWAKHQDSPQQVEKFFASECIANGINEVVVTPVNRLIGTEVPSIRYDQDKKKLVIKYTVGDNATCYFGRYGKDQMARELQPLTTCYVEAVKKIRKEQQKAATPPEPTKEQTEAQRQEDLNKYLESLKKAGQPPAGGDSC